MDREVGHEEAGPHRAQHAYMEMSRGRSRVRARVRARVRGRPHGAQHA